jgi:hypothetical protein
MTTYSLLLAVFLSGMVAGIVYLATLVAMIVRSGFAKSSKLGTWDQYGIFSFLPIFPTRIGDKPLEVLVLAARTLFIVFMLLIVANFYCVIQLSRLFR